ncbi:hypothetical protein QJQ45_000732 [Haematococcus lacustris]|nr:hypothetical protein QJQ45_000732 [Haematococcus lacustris]
MSDRRRRKKGAGATATSVAATAAATAADAVKIAISEVSRRISGGLSGLQSHVERDPSSSPDFADSPGDQHPFHSPLDRRTPGLPTVPESQPIGLQRGDTGGIALEPHHPPHTAVQQSAAAEDAQACLPQGQSAGNERPHALDGTGPSAFPTLGSCLTWLSAQAHQLTSQLLGSFPPPDAQAVNLRPPPSLLGPTPLPRWLPLCLLLGLLASFCLASSWSASSQRHLTVHLVSQLEAQAEEMAALQAWAQDLNTSWHHQLDEHLGNSSTQLQAEWKQQAAQALASQQQLAGELAAAKEQVQGLQGLVEELRGQVGAHAAGFVRFAQPLPLKGLAAITLAWPGTGATPQQVPVPVAVRVWLLLTAENGQVQVQVQVQGHTTDRSNSSLSNNRANSSKVASNVTSSSNMSSYSNSSNSNSSSSRGPTRDGGSAAASRGALQGRQSLEQPPAAAWLAARGWATQVIRLQPASQQPVQGQDPAGVAAGGKAEASRSSNNVASNRLSRLQWVGQQRQQQVDWQQWEQQQQQQQQWGA